MKWIGMAWGLLGIFALLSAFSSFVALGHFGGGIGQLLEGMLYVGHYTQADKRAIKQALDGFTSECDAIEIQICLACLAIICAGAMLVITASIKVLSRK